MNKTTMYLIAAAAAVGVWLMFREDKTPATSSPPVRPPGTAGTMPISASTGNAQALLASQIAAGGGNPGGQYDGFGGS